MTDYVTLQGEVASYLARDDLTGAIPGFIRLAEAKMNRELRIQAMEQRTPMPGNGTRYLALPTGFLEARRVAILGTNEIEPMTFVSPNSMRYNSGGNPTQYTVHKEMEFNAVVPASTTIEMVYFAPLAALSTPNPSNWVSLNAYDIYLYGALQEAEPFLRNDERIATWASGFSGAIAKLNKQDAKGRSPRTGRRMINRGSTP